MLTLAILLFLLHEVLKLVRLVKVEFIQRVGSGRSKAHGEVFLSLREGVPAPLQWFADGGVRRLHQMSEAAYSANCVVYADGVWYWREPFSTQPLTPGPGGM